MPINQEHLPVNNPDLKEKASHKFTYHHSRPLESVIYGNVLPVSPLDYNRQDDLVPVFDSAYRWLESKTGFYPLFLAVGRTTEDLRMTGYQNQWAKILAKGKDVREYRQKGAVENKILFSFRQLPPGGVFVDFQNWHLVLMLSDQPKQLEKYYHSIFRPSWNKNDWLTLANKNPHSVQLVVPSLDLSMADQVTVRNKSTKKLLDQMGFPNVATAQLTLGRTAL